MGNVPQEQQILIEAFRLAQRHVVSSVHLITTGAGECRSGMTATAVCSLSFEPLSILVCVNRNASIFQELENAGRFAVSILSEADQEIANMFGSSKLKELRYTSGEWQQMAGSPILLSAVANIACETLGSMDVGTHRVVAGQVVDVRVNPEARPLLYQHGGYCGTGPTQASVAQAA